MLELAQDVHVRYGNIRALQGVSLTVGQGELVALIGSNGAGKTTDPAHDLGPPAAVARARSRFEGADITRASTDRIVGARHLALPGGPADLRRPDGRARTCAWAPSRRRDRQAAAADLEMVLDALPAAQGAPRPGRRDALGRRAADAGHRPGADEPAAPAPARRAVAGPRAADGRADLRDDRGAQGARAGRSCSSSRTSTTRSTSPTAPTSWRRAGSPSTDRPTSCAANPKVEQSYLGVGGVAA